MEKQVVKSTLRTRKMMVAFIISYLPFGFAVVLYNYANVRIGVFIASYSIIIGLLVPRIGYLMLFTTWHVFKFSKQDLPHEAGRIINLLSRKLLMKALNVLLSTAPILIPVFLAELGPPQLFAFWFSIYALVDGLAVYLYVHFYFDIREFISLVIEVKSKGDLELIRLQQYSICKALKLKSMDQSEGVIELSFKERESIRHSQPMSANVYIIQNTLSTN
jgi:hypothetical protein